MGVQKRVYRPVEYDFPADFPERLELFLKKSGLSSRGLARLMGVSPDRVRKWRNKGVAPSHVHLFLLLTIAAVMGLRDGVLMQPEGDMPEGVEPEDLREMADGRRPEQT